MTLGNQSGVKGRINWMRRSRLVHRAQGRPTSKELTDISSSGNALRVSQGGREGPEGRARKSSTGLGSHGNHRRHKK